MKKNIISALLSVAMIGGVSTTASAAGPAPQLTPQEKVLFSLTEQAVGTIGAITDANPTGCFNANYNISATANLSSGSLTLDDRTFSATVRENNNRGTFVDVTSPGSGDVGNVGVRRVKNFFHFSKLGEIMYSNGDFQIKPIELGAQWEDYDLHVIKDFWWDTVFGGGPQGAANGVRDAGLEVVTKLDYPRSKWRQTSQYRRFDGIDGLYSVTKVLIAPDNAPGCKIQIRRADVQRFGNELELIGTLRVRVVNN